jgi:hypothetical protein
MATQIQTKRLFLLLSSGRGAGEGRDEMSMKMRLTMTDMVDRTRTKRIHEYDDQL